MHCREWWTFRFLEPSPLSSFRRVLGVRDVDVDVDVDVRKHVNRIFCFAQI